MLYIYTISWCQGVVRRHCKSSQLMVIKSSLTNSEWSRLYTKALYTICDCNTNWIIFSFRISIVLIRFENRQTPHMWIVWSSHVTQYWASFTCITILSSNSHKILGSYRIKRVQLKARQFRFWPYKNSAEQRLHI